MKNEFFLLASFLLAGTFTRAQNQEIFFDVIYKDEKVGVLHAKETNTGSKSVKLLTIETKTTFLFIPIHMESEVNTTQENGVLMEGTAYRNASRKSSDVVSTVKKIGPRLYQRELNGVKDKIKNLRITSCVVNLYFNEPLGVTRVFSNMYAQMLKLKRIDKGQYRLITPDNSNSLYLYRDGKLISIEVDTVVGKVISKRI
ncbi:MAG: DUF6134 family protein [Chryseolinea sp.]